MSKSKIILVVCSAVAILAGCSGDDAELSKWMEQQELKSSSAAVIPVAEPMEEVVQEVYNGDVLPSPLSTAKLRGQSFSATLPICILNQMERRENRPSDLESIPLESMEAVGFIKEVGSTKAMAMIQVGGELFKADVGHYIGLDYGRIVSISETKVHIVELLHTPGSDQCETRNVELDIHGGGFNEQENII